VVPVFLSLCKRRFARHSILKKDFTPEEEEEVRENQWAFE
jgi:hypothetical protein